MEIVILDACRDNPFRNLGAIAREVALTDAHQPNPQAQTRQAPVAQTANSLP
jgi:hypothetical protein